jgi:hypothetical protein
LRVVLLKMEDIKDIDIDVAKFKNILMNSNHKTIIILRETTNCEIVYMESDENIDSIEEKYLSHTHLKLLYVITEYYICIYNSRDIRDREIHCI